MSGPPLPEPPERRLPEHVAGRIVAGDVITLRGLTRKGKNRIQDYGERWLVRAVDQSALSNLGLLVCPASYLNSKHLDPAYDRPNSIHQVDGYCRWVRKAHDQHFEIIRTEHFEEIPT